jgi:hypothetical protein
MRRLTLYLEEGRRVTVLQIFGSSFFGVSASDHNVSAVLVVQGALHNQVRPACFTRERGQTSGDVSASNKSALLLIGLSTRACQCPELARYASACINMYRQPQYASSSMYIARNPPGNPIIIDVSILYSIFGPSPVQENHNCPQRRMIAVLARICKP